MTAFVRVYGQLNDFLPRRWRQEDLVCPLNGPVSVKDFVEGLGIPHPEIQLIVANGHFVDFDYRVVENDRIAVYPRFRSFDLEEDERVGPAWKVDPSFVADVHLGRLSAYLRFAGIDVAYRNDYSDHRLVAISAEDDRTILTRDIGVLKHRAVSRGYFVRNIKPALQFVEVLRMFELVSRASPFSRCVECNDLLRRASPESVSHVLPPRTRDQYREFSRCPGCNRVYWRGSHYARMTVFLDMAFAAAQRQGR
jgi:uncharacterized protein with PIN domain